MPSKMIGVRINKKVYGILKEISSKNGITISGIGSLALKLLLSLLDLGLSLEELKLLVYLCWDLETEKDYLSKSLYQDLVQNKKELRDLMQRHIRRHLVEILAAAYEYALHDFLARLFGAKYEEVGKKYAKIYTEEYAEIPK